MMLREYFYGTPRELQITALEQIESALQQGYHNIVISAPTGVGKSYIAVCLALAFKEGDILTATVQLQEQYLKDFPFVKTIAGRKNFNCPVYERPCSHIPTVRCKGMKRRSTADGSDDEGNSNNNNGNNSSNNNNNSTYIIPTCSLYPTRDDIKRITVSDKGTSNEKVVFNAKYNLCDYYIHKHIAYRASFRIFNYHEYFTLLNNIGSKSKLSTELLICDESHMLEEKVIDFYNVIIDDKLLRPLRKHRLIDIQLLRTDIVTEEMNYYRDLLSAVVAGYAELLNIIAEEIAKSEKEKEEGEEKKRKHLFKLAEYEERLQRLSTVLNVLSVYPENFIVDIVEGNTKQKQQQIVKLLPLNIAPFLREVFNRVKYRIFMSATIDYPIFKRELGLNDEDTILIDLPSPFPVQNRRVIMMNAYTLNKENMHNEKMLIQIASTIDRIMEKHKERGLILTTSYELASNIFRYSNNKHRLLLTKDMSAKEVLEKHAKTDSNVILTPSMWEGVDLKDDLCRFIIIAKTPYPSLADKRIKIKAERDKEWYKSVTLMRLIQGAGRGVRHEQDYCIAYVLDSNATWLISTKAKQNAVPRWFKDALVYSSNDNNKNGISRTSNNNY